MSRATTESDIFVEGGEKLFPVPTYSVFLFTSSVGAFHTAPPEGPTICVPSAFFCVGLARSAMVYVFQICLPVAASRARTLPRKAQQGYFGSPTWDSSREETGTYKRTPYNCGAPVIAAREYSSTLTFHTSLPDSASTA